ncbi:MAG: hypothetical protein SO253_00715 [Bacilli bacterium]|nr:hypothetical protein [Bacilli bacterium]
MIAKASRYPAISFSSLFFGVIFSFTSFFNRASVVLIPSIALLALVLCVLVISTNLLNSSSF